MGVPAGQAKTGQIVDVTHEQLVLSDSTERLVIGTPV
jgi:hypothetical protein